MAVGQSGIDDLKQFAVETVKAAGDEALRYYGKGNRRMKFDEALVTEAELHLIEFARQRLQERYPEHRMLRDGLPSQDYQHGQEGYLWTYDALDGVANFQAGIPLWGISLALLENFWPIFGVFYMPVTGDLFHASVGGKAYRGDEEIQLIDSGEVSNESLLFTYSRFHNHYRSGFPGKIRNLGCTAAHICYAACGRAEAALIANVSYQDLAAAQIILNAAGGKICKMDGSDFDLNDYLNGQRIEEHLLAAPRGAHSSIRMYLQSQL